MSRSRALPLFAALALSVGAVVLPTEYAVAAPGVPEDPGVIYAEGFEEAADDPQMLTTYNDFSGSSYWTRAEFCNGILLTASSPSGAFTDPGNSGTCSAEYMGRLRQIANAIGQANGSSDPNDNFVASSYSFTSGSSNEIQVETPDISVVPGRWYTASLRFGADNCDLTSPVYNFYLVDSDTEAETLVGGPVNACNTSAEVINSVRVGSIQSPTSLRWQGGNQLRLRVRNANGNGYGNDSAIDDLRLVQATPSLHKQWVPATGVALGETFLARFTVTNTSELAAKDNIDFADELPIGVTVGEDAPTTACGGTVTAVEGQRTVTVEDADLATGQASCVVDIPVTATETGVLTNEVEDIETPLVIDGGDTPVTVSDPSPGDDTASTAYDETVDVDVLENDEAGDPDYALDESSVGFPTTGQPGSSSVTDEGRTLTVFGQGVYTADTETGVVIFDPDEFFSGQAATVTYQVADSNEATATATLTISVAEPTVVAVDDKGKTAYDQNTTVDVLENDAKVSTLPISPTSVIFPTADQPEGATVTDLGKTLTVPGEGVYAIAAETGLVTFDPDRAYAEGGTTTAVSYQVSAALIDLPLRQKVRATATSDTATLRIRVGKAPEAAADRAETTTGRTVTVPVLDNDDADPGVPLDPATLRFPTDGQPDGSAVADDGTTLTVPGQGRYTIDTETGAITFTAEDGFSGETAPVTYQVSDENGNVVTGTLVVRVTAAPVANDDTVQTGYDETVEIDVLANDSGQVPLDPGSVVFVTAAEPSAAADVSGDRRKLTVEGEGVYTIDRATGAVTFNPARALDGETTTPVTYAVSDVNGGVAAAAVRVEVAAERGGGSDPGDDTPADRDPTRPDLADTGGPSWAASLAAVALLAAGALLTRRGSRVSRQRRRG